MSGIWPAGSARSSPLDRAEPHSAQATARLAVGRSASIGLDVERARVSFAKGLSVRRLAEAGTLSAP